MNRTTRELKGDERSRPRKQQRGRAALDLGLEAVNRKLGVLPRDGPVGDAVLPAWGSATPKARCFRGR